MTNLILTPISYDSNDFRTLLFELDYTDMVDWCKSSYIEKRGENIPVQWTIWYPAYVDSCLRLRGLDFTSYPVPEEPKVDMPDDLSTWVEAMEAEFGGDYEAAYSQQFTGINMF